MAGHKEPTDILAPPTSLCAAYPNSANCAPPDQFSYGGVTQPILLTDGSILFITLAVDDDGVTTEPVYKFSPDKYGNYINGTWTKITDLPIGYYPFVYGSAVLADGRVVITGGEYDFVTCPFPTAIAACGANSNQSAIYDPALNQWASIAPPSFFTDFVPSSALEWIAGFSGYTFTKTISDSQTVVLPNGKLMIAQKTSRLEALLDPKTLTWTQTGSGKADINTEEGWTLLPSGKVLTVDIYGESKIGLAPLSSYPTFPNNTRSEIYNPDTGSWQSAGSTLVPLGYYDANLAIPAANYIGTRIAGATGTPASLCPAGATQGNPNCPSDIDAFLTLAVMWEIGPQPLLPNGKVVAFGATGNNAIYNSSTGMWTTATSSPSVNINGQLTQLVNGDTGAVVMPNGNILVELCAGVESTPCYFYETDGSKFQATDSTPDAAAVAGIAFMMVLPNGQVMSTDENTDVQIYTPDQNKYNPSWAPVVTKAPTSVKPGGHYTITGIRFNGMTQANFFGDDSQNATNYPLVRITNLSTGHVTYSRTHDHSYMGVASNRKVSTQFDVPTTQELGKSILEVVTNGIPSIPQSIIVSTNAP